MEQGLQARIYDPLWLLARQWQTGEFRGEDNGTPVSARVRAECAVLTRYAPVGVTPGERYDVGQLPLETLVEREKVRPRPGRAERLRIAVHAGQHFLRLVPGANRAALLRDFPLPVSDEPFVELMRGRVPDGAKLYAALKSPNPPSGMDFALVSLFLFWYEQLFSEPAGTEAWIPQRMEYQFSVAAPGGSSAGAAGNRETVLTSEYYDGELDWHDFDTDSRTSLGAAADRVEGQNPLPLVRTVIPAPVTFRGMPAPRWWEFEDAAVDFGSVDLEPTDLARMLMVEFAVTYGNDWFVIPVDLPAGSLCEIRSLVVTDTFGVKTLIPSIQSSTHPLSAKWRMFNNAQDARAFFLAPTLVRKIEGKPIEDVLFLRDEMANLAWGVERQTEGVTGDPVNRREKLPAPLPKAERELPAWRLSTEVPDYWIPLVPVKKDPVSDPESIVLRRGAMLRPDGSLRPQTAQGRVLVPEQRLDIFEEEVPREGMRVTRSFQFARWIDGQPLLWIGRLKQIEKREGSSGLRFDVLGL